MSKGTILVVEPDEDNRYKLLQDLTSWDYATGSIGSIEEVANYATDYQLFLIADDNATNHAFYVKIRELAPNIGIILIILFQPEDVINGNGSILDDYISKPFARLELKARIDAFFRRKNLAEDYINEDKDSEL